MLPTRELVEPAAGASFLCRLWGGKAFAFKWHLHPEYELTHIISGKGRRFVGDHVEDFSAGEVVMLGPNLPHTWHAKAEQGASCNSVVIQFTHECFGASFFDLPELHQVRTLLARSHAGLQFTGPMRRRVAQTMQAMLTQNNSERMLSLLEILQILARCRTAVKLTTHVQAIPLRERDQKRIDKVLRHLNEHYTQPMDQAAIARQLHLSASAFSRFFGRMTGRTFVDFLTDLRINHAMRLLVETDEPVTAICHDSGFGNLSNFNRRFRQKCDCSPREFRNRSQATSQSLLR